MALDFIRPEYVEKVNKLTKKLTAAGIHYEVAADCFSHGFIILFPSIAEREGDVILHDYSYGHELGLFEGAGAMSKDPEDVYVFESIKEVVDWAKQAGF